MGFIFATIPIIVLSVKLRDGSVKFFSSSKSTGEGIIEDGLLGIKSL